MPPLFFRKQRWWLWPLVMLPETFLGHWLHNRMGKLAPPTKLDPKDLWEGRGVLLLYSTDPEAFALRPAIQRLLLRFPDASLVVHESQAAWWQAFFPGNDVRSIPTLDLWNKQDKAWLKNALPALLGDWCWNLREDEHPFSRALTRILGRAWKIGMGPSPWADVSIEPPAGLPPLSGARIGTVARTFGWAEIPPETPVRGKTSALHVPDLSGKKHLLWQAAVQELVRTTPMPVYQSGSVGGLGALDCKALPSPSVLLKLAPSLSRWIGPWDAHAGALAACGVEITIVGPAPKGCAHRQVPSPRQGQTSAWSQAILKA